MKSIPRAGASIERRILERVRESPGQVFARTHFLDAGSTTAVGVALHRLVRAGALRRIRPGVYDLPDTHPILGLTSPDPMEVARAIMTRNHATWQPSGAYAANLLGLTDQVPAKIVLLTDGVSRRVSLGRLTLDFRRASPRNLIGAGKTSGLVIQALRHVGNGAVTPAMVRRLRRTLDHETRTELIELSPRAPAWMRPVLLSLGSRRSHHAVRSTAHR